MALSSVDGCKMLFYLLTYHTVTPVSSVPKYQRHSHLDTIRPRGTTRSRSIDGSSYGASVPVRIIRSDIPPIDKHLFDIIKTNKDIKLIVQIPFVMKNEIKLRAIGKRIEIFAKTNSGPYHKYVNIPSGAYVHSAKSRYNNGILEITFSKKEHQNVKSSKKRSRIMY